MIENHHNLNVTSELPEPTYYARALMGEFSAWAYCEQSAPKFKGFWREKAFRVGLEAPMDLEIGTGNGLHFANYCHKHPDRSLIGLEVKYKPLIQSIRRALHQGSKNGRIARYNASFLDHLFMNEELNNVIIHHPDPWPKERHLSRRIIQTDFLETLFLKQKPGSRVDFKTDDRDYFDWAVEKFQSSPYEVTALTYDLHHSEWSDENFVTAFEALFLKKGQPIYFARLVKN